MNLAALTGPDALGGAYRIMLESDPHARGSVLSMADRGWPGGLRWLHGEAHG